MLRKVLKTETAAVAIVKTVEEAEDMDGDKMDKMNVKDVIVPEFQYS